MASIGDLVVNLGMNTGGFNAGLASSNRGLTSLATGVTRSVAMIKGALSPLAPLAAAVGAAMGFTAVINSARDAVQQQNKLEAVIKATGGAAGLTSNQMMDLANDMANLTNFEDDAVVGAQAVLATFKEVKGDQFKEGTRLAADMASVLGGDLNGSIMQVGKALNDPTKGITALARAGVSFTEQQKQQIKAMQASGNMIGAQQIILKELRSEFGGAAEAMADPFTRMWNVIGNVGESIGMLILPAINAVANGISEVVGPLANGGDLFGGIGEQIGSLTSMVIRPFVTFFRTGVEWIVAGFGLLSPLMGKVNSLVVSIGWGFQGMLSTADQILGVFASMFQPLFDSIDVLLGSHLPAVSGGFKSVADFASWAIDGIGFVFRNMSDISQMALIDLVTLVIDRVPGAEQALTAIGSTMIGVFEGIKAAMPALVQDIVAGFTSVSIQVISTFMGMQEAIKSIMSGEGLDVASQKMKWVQIGTETMMRAAPGMGDLLADGGDAKKLFSDAFNQSSMDFKSKVDGAGGLRSMLQDQKMDLQWNIAEREAAFQSTLTAPDIQKPALSSGTLSGGGSGTGDKYVKTEALQQGSKEAFSAIQSFLFGGQGDTAKQQLSVQQQQLDATGEQNAVLAEIRDGMAEDRAAREMDPGVAF